MLMRTTLRRVGRGREQDAKGPGAMRTSRTRTGRRTGPILRRKKGGPEGPPCPVAVLRLEREPRHDLQQPGEPARGRDAAEARGAERHVRSVELRVVEDVDDLGPDHQRAAAD